MNRSKCGERKIENIVSLGKKEQKKGTEKASVVIQPTINKYTLQASIYNSEEGAELLYMHKRLLSEWTENAFFGSDIYESKGRGTNS